MDTRNLDVLRRIYDALAAGEFVPLMSLLPDEIAAHVPGISPVAGDYVGKAAVGGYVGMLGELSGGTLRFEPHDVLASDIHGVGLVRDLAERGAKTLAMNNVHVWHIADGVPTEIWICPGDLRAWDDFWS
jgi:ketosteroid isomerase-like protein